jgi:hypothetical protein
MDKEGERVIFKLPTNCVKRMRLHSIFCQLYEQHLSLKICERIPAAKNNSVLAMYPNHSHPHNVISFLHFEAHSKHGVYSLLVCHELITFQQNWFTAGSLA